MKGPGNEKVLGRENKAKTKDVIKAQCLIISFAFIKGKTTKPIPLVQLEHVVEQGQPRQPKQLSSHGNLQPHPRQKTLSRLKRPGLANVRGLLRLLKAGKVTSGPPGSPSTPQSLPVTGQGWHTHLVPLTLQPRGLAFPSYTIKTFCTLCFSVSLSRSHSLLPLPSFPLLHPPHSLSIPTPAFFSTCLSCSLFLPTSAPYSSIPSLVPWDQ